MRLISVLTLVLLACGDNARNANPDAAPMIDAAPTVDAASPDASPPPPAPGLGFAVVHSDFVTTRISLLSDTGALAHDDCITSATVSAAAPIALTGDVVLPSWPLPGHPLVAIDRKKSALTWIDPATCAPVRQLDVSTGFKANPHDVVGVSPTKAYVLRYETNATPTPNPDDRDDGDDLLIIDPSVPAITGRISLARYAVALDGTTIQARPDRARLIGGKLYVTLGNQNADFSAATHGRIVVIDPATDAVTGTIDIAGFKNCVGLSAIDASHTLVVTCGGAFSDTPQAAGSGVVYLDLAASPPVERRRVTAAAFGNRPLAAFSGIALDGALGFGATNGDFAVTPKDQLWRLEATAAAGQAIDQGTSSFVYGSVVIDPSHERVYLTDGDASVRTYHYDGTADATIASNPAGRLPPRELAWY